MKFFRSNIYDFKKLGYIFFSALCILGGLLLISGCKPQPDDPALIASKKELNKLLEDIPNGMLSRDSLLKAAALLTVEKHTDLVNEVASKYSTEIEKSRSMRQRDEMIKSQFNLRDGSHIKTKYAVQESMDDPDSFEHVSTTYVDNGEYLTVKMRFRMRDPAGVMRLNMIGAKVDIEGNVLEGDISRIPE